MLHRVIVLIVTISVGLGVAIAQVPEPLVAGRTALFKDSTTPGRDQAKVTFTRDSGLFSLDDPTCDGSPMGAFVRLSTSEQVNPQVFLPCENWTSSGSGFRYKDKAGTAGGVQKVLYKLGKLSIKAKGPAYTPPIVGPVSFADVRFDVGDEHYCGRFSTFTRNQANQVRAAGPTEACQVVCGDGILEGAEDCDDGNVDEGDGCDTNCTASSCGNGITTAGEACDDGNMVDGDGCRADCTLEVCGDGILDAGEDCDDGGTADGDCCSSTCAFEAGPCDDGDNCTENDVCQAGACVGNLLTAWINEIDYDNFVSGVIDREEFVEIAGPAGLDLGGYTLFGVEGADGSCATPGSGVVSPVLPGYVHWSVTMPPDTVLEDDTGTGIGFLVVCNTPSSQVVIDDGNCDIIFPGIASDSNFKNGHLLNDPNVCPDGMLLLDGGGNFADAVSYEGIVPEAGPLGSYFHVDPPYNAGADEGWKPKTSLEKFSSTLGKAMDATEWRDSGGCTNQCVAGGFNYNCDWILGLDPCLGFSATPGGQNGGQQYFCSALFCGDGFVTGTEQCDEGAGNSDAPDASCRTDCTLRRCGDGIVDPTAAPGFTESCELDSDCAGGEVCAACECTTGTPLGDVDLTVVPGSAAENPPDVDGSTWLRINQPVPPLLAITTGSNGQWTEGPLEFTAGAPGVDGVARFHLAGEVLMSAPLPALAGGGRVCVKVRPDYDQVGLVDCDGGSNVDVNLSIDSQGGGAALPATLTVPANATDSGAGAAVAYIIIEAGTTGDNTTPCEDAIYGAPVHTAVTTGLARSEIVNGFAVGTVAISLSGQPFDCGNWTTDAGASVAWPTYNLDVSVPVLGVQDVAQILRLNDD
jgi:cysteine-rich repeat protein